MAERFSDWLPTLLATQATAETLASGLVIGVDVQAWDADLDAIAGLTPTDNKIMAGNGSAWVLADQFTHGLKAAMLAADMDALFHRRDTTWLSEYTYDATVTIAQHQALVADERYVPPSAGADGAWVLRAADPRAEFFTNSATPAVISRFGRMFVGESTAFNGSTEGSATGHSWLDTASYYDGGDTLRWIETAGRMVSVTSYGSGVVGAGRTVPGGAEGQSAFGGIFHVVNAKPTSTGKGWAMYIDAVRLDLAGSTYGYELAICNTAASPTAGSAAKGALPFGAYPQGMTFGGYIQSGGGPTVHATIFPADCALYISTAGSTFWTGITFNQSLEDWADGYTRALNMPDKAIVGWWGSEDFEQFGITSEITGSTNAIKMHAENTGLVLRNNAGVLTHSFAKATGTPNYLYMAAGASPIYGVLGPSTNIDLTLTPKGTGQVVLGTSGSAALPAITFTGDPDTGIMRVGANQVALVTGGVRGLQIDSATSTDPVYIRVGSALVQVTADVADSGGAGYRRLRVPN